MHSCEERPTEDACAKLSRQLPNQTAAAPISQHTRASKRAGKARAAGLAGNALGWSSVVRGRRPLFRRRASQPNRPIARRTRPHRCFSAADPPHVRFCARRSLASSSRFCFAMPSGHVDNAIGIANLPNQRHKIVAKRCVVPAVARDSSNARAEVLPSLSWWWARAAWERPPSSTPCSARPSRTMPSTVSAIRSRWIRQCVRSVGSQSLHGS